MRLRPSIAILMSILLVAHTGCYSSRTLASHSGRIDELRSVIGELRNGDRVRLYVWESGKPDNRKEGLFVQFENDEIVLDRGRNRESYSILRVQKVETVERQFSPARTGLLASGAALALYIIYVLSDLDTAEPIAP